jgi:signal transduction histidine kinase
MMPGRSLVGRDLEVVSSPHSALDRAQLLVHEQRLLVTFEIAKILVTEHDLEAMLPRFLSCLIKMLDAADAGTVWLNDPSDSRLVAKGAQGYELTALQQIRLSPGEAITGKVFQSGQAELYPTPEAAIAAMADLTPPHQELFERATAGLTHPLSAVCVPLAAGQEMLGVLTLLNLRQPGGFTGEDLAFLQRVTDLITVAIETAQLREELDAAHALSEANRLKAELVSTLAHEMRTPLTSIKGYSTALLMDEVTFDVETQREFLQIIDQECDILQDLIHGLLESSIIDAGLMRLELQPVRLPLLAERVTDDMARRWVQHRFLVDFPPNFPIMDADPDRVSQVLRNLLDNAVKYSPDAGLIVVRGQVREDEVAVSVADQGIGIAPEHLNRLFEKFFRAGSLLGRHVVGSGLGLPIAHAIVEGHGGRIWAVSQLGQGSTFYFTLPRKGPSEELAGLEVSRNG